MRKIFLIILSIIFFTNNFQAFAANCHNQRNPIGYVNYDICEVEGTDFVCVSLEGKDKNIPGGISCFKVTKHKEREDDEEVLEQKLPKLNSAAKPRFGERKIGEGSN